MSERIVITGLGLVSSIGVDPKTYWKALLEATSSLPEEYPYTRSEYMRNRCCYYVREQKPPSFLVVGDSLGKASDFAIRASQMALQDAGLLNSTESSSIGISIGTAMGDADLIENSREKSLQVSGIEAFNFKVASSLGCQFVLSGPNLSVSTACSSGTYSVSLAVEAIRSGWADVMLVGGAEAFSRVVQACFNRLEALDPEVCRPFDAQRGGTVFGEGAAILVLESESHARRRGWLDYYAQVKGCGWSCDGYHPTAPDPTAQHPKAALQRALVEAELSPDEIDCVIPHGTGTVLNDLMESNMLAEMLGDRIDQLLVCALKSKIGHTGGAAGAFSCLTAAMILKHGIVPPTANITTVDSKCGLKLHRNAPIQSLIRNVLINAYAFGGNNISLIMGAVS